MQLLPTYHELHVAGTGRLSAGSRDLLTQVSSGDDLFSQGDSVVLQVDHLQLVSHNRVVVNNSSHVTD